LASSTTTAHNFAYPKVECHKFEKYTEKANLARGGENPTTIKTALVKKAGDRLITTSASSDTHL
jgi:hypothetical protein